MLPAKIVCTLGPASQETEVLAAMAEAGMDVVRLNMSHGDHASHARAAERVRELSERTGRRLAILLDLSGPKIRLGEVQGPVLLHAGQEVELTTEDVVGSADVLPVRYPALPEEVKPGDPISLADGLIRLEVVSVQGRSVRARVVSGGQVSSHKGLNLPGRGDSLPALTSKDEADLRFGLRLGVDWVALSFVRSPRDLEPVLRVMAEEGVRVPVLAKIEKRQALERIDEILEVFDGIMVARGDLGVEVPVEEVPVIQKDLIRRANRVAKPVITATQMLLSMVREPQPTRAEVTDVANAILDGTDAVMLSEETAVGRHPVEAVRTMARVAERVRPIEQPDGRHAEELAVGGTPAAIARATWRLTRDVGARAVVTPTRSGSTARLVAATRPGVPILALSSDPRTLGALCLSRGVVPHFLEPVPTTDALFEACRRKVLELGLARPGERIVVTAGLPLETPGTTNLVKVLELKAR